MVGATWAAAPHYSLFTAFPPTNTGTAQTNPQAIILGKNGYIYGVSTGGGYNGKGGVFDVRPNGLIDTMIDFDTQTTDIGWITPPSLPANNFTPLALLPDGSFFGVSNTGGYIPSNGIPSGDPEGVAYNVMGTTGAFGVLHTFFPSTGDVTQPVSIALGSDGNLYGLATGGTWSGGTQTSTSDLFQLTQNGQVTDLYSFNDSYPSPFLALDPSNDMYVAVGSQIDKVTPGGTENVVHTLDVATEGQGIDDLVSDASGNLYGSALSGGPAGNGDGTVFEISASGGFSVLHSFSAYLNASQQGYGPNSLVAASDGNVYGMTRFGGSPSNPSGTLFRITPSGMYTVLHTFGTSQMDGSNARSLIQVGPRTFYGVVDGGPNGTGAIFKLVVPIQDDVYGSGDSSLIMSGPGALNIGTTSDAGTITSIAAGYFPVAIGDLNGDGMADIVWSSANDDLYIWFGGTSGFQAKYAGTYPAGWQVEGAGDINGDGKDDLIWLNDQTHQFAYWLMNGTNRIGWRVISVAAGYYPAALGDFDGNGKLDIMWTSAHDDLYVWLGNGSEFSSKYITTYPAGWRIVGRGDLNGDGSDDLIWSTTDGQNWGYWLMNGSSIARIDAYTVPAGLSGYSIVANSDYNGDGRADIIWSNGSTAVPWLNQGQCSATVSCAFTAESSLAVPASQPIFNSSIPVSLQVNK